MKRILTLGIALSLFVSCGKQQTEEERNAEVERRVQERMAAERHAEEQEKLAQREAELVARENALAEKENTAVQTATPEMRVTQMQRDVDESENVAEDGSEGYGVFYTKLEPYGAWRQTSDYGYVWQPNVAEGSRSWRPYTNGRWVYTDAGWTWYSEEPFGWATYHYGRWMRLRNVGWVWVPGNEWAPAWVSWRKSDEYVGWAPLPPEARFDRRTGIHNWADNYYDIGPEQYCFVPANDFGEQRIERTVVPVERNITIVNQTLNVTNITYSNTTIVNQGPNFEEMRKRSRRPIQRLRLERQNALRAENPRSVVRGEVIEMPAPVIAPARRSGRPRAVRETVAQPTVDRGWDGIRDRQAAEKARAKMKAEATPPPDAPAPTFAKPDTPPAATPAVTAPGVPKRESPPPSEIVKGRKDVPKPKKRKEAEKTQADQKPAEEKAAQDQKPAEAKRRRAEPRKGKAKSTQTATPEPSVSPRPTPPKPIAVPPAAAKKPSPAAGKKTRAATPPAVSPSPSPKSPGSPTPTAADRKEAKGKKKNKRDRESDASPSPSPRQQ